MESKTTLGRWGKGGGRGRAAGTWSSVLGAVTYLVSGERAAPALELSPNLTPLSEAERQREGISGWVFLMCF